MKKKLLAIVGLIASLSIFAACDFTGGTSSSTENSSSIESSDDVSNDSVSGEDGSSDEEHTHSYENSWAYDENNHWKACTGEECDSKTEEGAHNGGTATCETKAVCEGCGQVYGELGEHTYADTLTKGEETHWYAATCVHNDLKKDENAHVYGEFEVTTEAIGSAVGEKTATCECGATKTEAYVNTGITGIFGTDVNVATTQGKAENQLDGSLKVYSDWWVKVAFDGVIVPANATHIIIKMKANQQLTGDDGTGILFEATGVSAQNIGIVETEYKEFKIALSTSNCALDKFNVCVQDGTGVGDSVNNWKVIYIESITFEVLKESDTPTQTTIFGGETPITVGATQGSAVAMSDGSLKLTGAWWVNATFEGVTIPANAIKMVVRAKANQVLTGVLYNMSYPGTSIAADEATGLSIGTEYQDFEISLKTNNCSLTNFNLCVQDDGSGVWKIVYIESITYVIEKAPEPTDTPNVTTIFGAETPVTVGATQGSAVAMSDGSLKLTGAWWVNATFEGVTIPENVTKMIIRAKANQALTGVLYAMSYPGTNVASDEATGLSIGTEYQDFEITLNTNDCSLTNFNLCVQDDGSGAWKVVYIESITFA